MTTLGAQTIAYLKRLLLGTFSALPIISCKFIWMGFVIGSIDVSGKQKFPIDETVIPAQEGVAKGPIFRIPASAPLMERGHKFSSDLLARHNESELALCRHGSR